jgi:hypothetical protein
MWSDSKLVDFDNVREWGEQQVTAAISASITVDYRLDGWGLIPSRSFSLHSIQTESGHPTSCTVGTGSSFLPFRDKSCGSMKLAVQLLVLRS